MTQAEAIRRIRRLKFSGRTLVMGILNRTPDSFSDGGEFMAEDAALRHIKRMAREGADIIDIGGESTRPGSEPVGISEEIERTAPIIRKAAREIDIPISIDTSKHEVAAEAILAGASMVNDVTALKKDPKIAGVVSESGAFLSVMHMKGAPKTMQDNPVYGDLMAEIINCLRKAIDIAQGAGVSADKIIVDPGIGFGKTLRDNLAILKNLRALKVLGKPVLIGTSRKSFIGEILAKDARGRIIGTAATCALAILNGADIIRVHEVKEMVEAARIADAVKAGVF